MDEESNKPVWDEREVSFMMAIQHERLVTFMGAGEVADERSCGEPVLFMVQEYMSGGSIDRRLWDQPLDSLSDEHRLVWACDIAEAMAFIHQRGFTHRDLKSQNVLYDRVTMRAKVADFGMSRSLSASAQDTSYKTAEELSSSDTLGDSSYMTAECGTPQWMAPELCDTMLERRKKLDGIETDPRGRKEAMQSYYAVRDMKVEYSQKVDTYAFGIVLHEILTHQAPWKALTNEGIYEVFRSVVTGKRLPVTESRRNEMSAWCKLMEACWGEDPARRPSFDDALDNLRMLLSLIKNHQSRQTSPEITESYNLSAIRESPERRDSVLRQVRTWAGWAPEELQESLLGTDSDAVAMEAL